MGEIFVEGLGSVQIEGNVPTPDEEQAIVNAISQANNAPRDLPISGPGGQVLQRQLTPLETAQDQTQAILKEGFEEPSFLEKLFPNNGRAATIAALGTAGAAQGARVSPNPALKLLGTLAGGALGVAEGSLINDISRGTPFDESVFNAVNEAETELLFSAGVPSAFQALRVLGPQAGRVLGVASEEARKLADFANQRGAGFGVADATRFTPVSGIKKVLGVFPFISGPFNTSTARSQIAIDRELNRFLNQVSPSISLQDAGVDAIRAARKASKDFKRVAGDLYRNADEAAASLVDESGNVIPIVRTRSLADEARAISQEFTAPLPKGVKRVEGNEAVRELFTGVQNLGSEKITVQELRGIQQQIQELMGQNPSNVDFARLARLKKSTENALADLDLSNVDPDQAQNVLGAFNDANTFFAKGMKVFDNATSRKATRVDRNIFKAGPERPGSLEPDEFLRAALNFRSPKSISSLRRLLGDKQFNQSFRAFLDEQVSLSTRTGKSGDTVIDFDRLARNIGLDGVRKSKQALAVALKGSGIDIKNLEAFFDIARDLGPVTVPSSFVARRATLGGFQSALNAITGAGIVGTSAALDPTLFKAVIGVLAIRQGAKVLSSPNVLRLMTRVTDESISDVQKKTALTRLARLAFSDE